MEVSHEGGVKCETDGKLGDAQVGPEGLEQLFHSLAAEGVVVEQHSLDGAPALLDRLCQLGRRLFRPPLSRVSVKPNASARSGGGHLIAELVARQVEVGGTGLGAPQSPRQLHAVVLPACPPPPAITTTHLARGGGKNEERTFVGQLAGELDLLELGLDSGGLAQPRYPTLHVHLPLFLINLFFSKFFSLFNLLVKAVGGGCPRLTCRRCAVGRRPCGS
jgi:hypothetical protein